MSLLGANRWSLAVCGGALGVIALAAAVARSEGDPPVPLDGDERAPLELVSARGHDPRLAELARLRAKLGRTPTDERQALQFARMAMEEGRRQGDPRHFGQAEAALAPWWSAAAPPEDIQLLRATLRQTRHDFSGALADLDGLLSRAPTHPQALLTRAVVLTVLGRHAEALGSCARLPAEVSPLVRAACAAPSRVAGASRSPEVDEALRVVTAALTGAHPTERAWGHSLIGELRFWAGQSAVAERELRRALALDPADRYTLATYADLLLDAGRDAEVSALLTGRQADEALLLRLAVAEHRQGSARARELTQELAERFAAARRRGDQTHLREEARFALELADEPKRALDLALAGWQVQREPWDARLVLASARAAGQVERAAQVAAYVDARGPGWAGVSRSTAPTLSSRSSLREGRQ